jgi:CO dehydrogenase/acetyl-CoA synthase beta subunit
MSPFDAYIEQISKYIQNRHNDGAQVRVLRSPSDPTPIDMTPIRVGPGASSGIVLKSDTFVELGSPSAGSCSLVLYSNSSSLVKDGQISLIGPDINESPSASLPFGQVITVQGENLNEREYQLLLPNLYVADRIEGYMVKTTSERIWSRVSREVAEKGFSFGVLGHALMNLIKSESPEIQAVEILFVTSAKEDLQPLIAIGEQVEKISREMRGRVWQEKGVDIFDCELGGHCGSCSDKSACNDVKKMLVTRRTLSNRANL